MFQELFHVPVVVPRIFMTCGPGQQDDRKVIPYTIFPSCIGRGRSLAAADGSLTGSM
jgi:hypothetical protein